MTYQDILFEARDGVATITINRPQVMNAFRGQTCEELIHALNRAGWDKSIGVIVLTGAGDRAFCTGGDQSAHDGQYDGYIRIAGRSKDIIIRGGENIPVVEVEGLLFKHPAVAEVAIVGFPDARLGERACAFVRLRDGASLTLPEVTAYLEAQRMARQYTPERLEVVQELPRTPSGKIQKFKLREIARTFGQG